MKTNPNLLTQERNIKEKIMSVPQFKIEIPCSSEFVGVVRLAISGLASRMQFSIEEIEDIKKIGRAHV